MFFIASLGSTDSMKTKSLKILGSPVVNPVLNASHERYHGSIAPDYLVHPVNWSDVDTQFIRKESCLIDFGRVL